MILKTKLNLSEYRNGSKFTVSGGGIELDSPNFINPNTRPSRVRRPRRRSIVLFLRRQSDRPNMGMGVRIFFYTPLVFTHVFRT